MKSKNIDATSNEATLDNYVGSGSTYMNKKEQAPLFNPGLANNGFSSAARTRHINIRYFFVKDRIAKGEIKIEYCLTKLMVADVLTKPVQGRLFLELRDLLLGYKEL